MPDEHWWTHTEVKPSPLERVSWEEFLGIVKRAPPWRFVEELIAHHTAEPEQADYVGHPTWAGIQGFHMRAKPKGRGWSDIGYHIGLSPTGDIWLLRPVTREGGHTKYHNARSIGVTMIGHYGHGHDENPPLERLAQVFAALCIRYQLNERDVNFHSDFANKDCPGSTIERATVRSMTADAIAALQVPPEEDADEDKDEPDTEVPSRYFREDPPDSNEWRELLEANGPEDDPVGKVFLRDMQ